MNQPMKLSMSQRLPKRLLFLGRFIARLPREFRPVLNFVLSNEYPDTTLGWRAWFVWRIYRVSLNIDAQHNQVEILRVADAILRVPRSTPGCIVEAGAFKGASAAKYSLIAARTGRKLMVFDSFEGIPPNEEAAANNIYGVERHFPKGSYAGSLDEVRSAVNRFGDPSVCSFVKGWLDDTLPGFHEPVVVAFIDVDLASSTRTAFKYLWPLVCPGGAAFSHDGGLPAVRAVLEDEAFWREQVGCERPPMRGLGKSRLVQMFNRPASAVGSGNVK